MKLLTRYLLLYLTQTVMTVKVKVIMHSDEDSRIEEEETHTESWDPSKKVELTILPFLKKRPEEKQMEYEDEKSTTEKPPLHPNDILFPLIYHQMHINSMFKFGNNWYTWSTETRTDGSTSINYYVCYDEPKHCDEIGWERIDTIPKCAFQVETLLADDRACINHFGVMARPNSGCDGGELMKVSDMVHACGPRIRSLWRFVRVGRRPANVAKPADVNSLACEDEDECYLTLEYRIHHDRITFSLHEPSRGQTFKSALKREVTRENKIKVATRQSHNRIAHGSKKKQIEPQKSRKNRNDKTKNIAEGKGVVKERNKFGLASRRPLKKKIEVREDISEDLSE